ncbi:MAG: alpha/beta fold hydrolase [Synechocystis sp.]|nr:alpha/beta fold hydrolase [Synechocystis sp.]
MMTRLSSAPTPIAVQSPLECQTWRWRDHQICYTVQGDGIPLVLIHGFGASVGHWRKNITPLAQAGYRVYALDLLGFGASDKPILDYSLDLWLEQLTAFWQEQIQQPAVWIGNSIGALLALMVLAQRSELAIAGVLLNAAGGLNHRPEEMPFPLNVIMGSFTRLVASPLVGPILFNQVRRKARIRQTLYQVYGDRQAVTDELVEMLYQPSCHPNAAQVFASILTAPAGIPPRTLLEQVEQPLLVLWGDKDPWTPISASGLYQQRAKMDPLSAFSALPGAGHCPHDEQPDRVNQQMIDWLATVVK